MRAAGCFAHRAARSSNTAIAAVAATAAIASFPSFVLEEAAVFGCPLLERSAENQQRKDHDELKIADGKAEAR
jgi:hypothetical protein